MIIADELKALGAPEWLLLHIEKTVKGSFFLLDLLRPLVLRLGLQDEVLKRQRNKLIQQQRELDAKNRRIANLTKEKLWWEATNHKRNEYIEELKKAKKDAEQETTRVKRVYNDLKLVTFGTRYGVDVKEFVARCTPSPAVMEWAKKGGRIGILEPNPQELQAAYYAQRDMGMGCKVPEPEQPYVPFRDKTAWAIGDKVRINEHLKGVVRHISCNLRSGVHTVGILTGSTGEMETTHWLGRKRQGGDIEYLNQYTQMTK